VLIINLSFRKGPTLKLRFGVWQDFRIRSIQSRQPAVDHCSISGHLVVVSGRNGTLPMIAHDKFSLPASYSLPSPFTQASLSSPSSQAGTKSPSSAGMFNSSSSFNPFAPNYSNNPRVTRDFFCCRGRAGREAGRSWVWRP
jgi:hypothetical protein